MGGEQDKAEGAWDNAKGKVKEKVGEMTGDESTEAEGAKGDIKEAGEKVKDSINKAFD